MPQTTRRNVYTRATRRLCYARPGRLLWSGAPTASRLSRGPVAGVFFLAEEQGVVAAGAGSQFVSASRSLTSPGSD